MEIINNSDNDISEEENALNISNTEDELDIIKPINSINNYKKADKKISFCNNNISAFIIFFIESFISLVLFYILYELEVAKIYTSLTGSLCLILFSYYFIIYWFIISNFYKTHKKCRNYILFILLSIYKIIFGFFAFIFIVSYSDKELDYPYFKARAFWKISMCFFYLFLIIYSCLKKKKNSSNIFIYIIFALICFLGLFLSVYFTRTDKDNWELIIYYLFYSVFEIIFTISGIYSEKILGSCFEECRDETPLDSNIFLKIWKVNKIDMCRYQFPFFIFLLNGLFGLCKKSRCCQKICRCCDRENHENSCCCLDSRFCQRLIKNFS